MFWVFLLPSGNLQEYLNCPNCVKCTCKRQGVLQWLYASCSSKYPCLPNSGELEYFIPLPRCLQRKCQVLSLKKNTYIKKVLFFNQTNK